MPVGHIGAEVAMKCADACGSGQNSRDGNLSARRCERGSGRWAQCGRRLLRSDSLKRTPEPKRIGDSERSGPETRATLAPPRRGLLARSGGATSKVQAAGVCGMPLFGRAGWSPSDLDAAIRDQQLSLEMPPAPLLYKHALTAGRRIAIQAVAKLGVLETVIADFEVFGVNCDLYCESRGLPFAAKERDVLSGDRDLLGAARLACLKRHFDHMVLQLGVDVALTLGAKKASWSLARMGKVGSPRWKAAQLVVVASGTKMMFDHVHKPRWTVWSKLVLHTAHTTLPMPDLGRGNADETLERLFPIGLSAEAPDVPDLCECGCSVRSSVGS